jgi:hypothetical protein
MPATTPIPASGENQVQPDTNAVAATTAQARRAEFVAGAAFFPREAGKEIFRCWSIIGLSYWPDFGAGVTCSFCSRHGPGDTGRWLL